MAETVTIPRTDAAGKVTQPAVLRAVQVQQPAVSLRGDGLQVAERAMLPTLQQQSAEQFYRQQQVLEKVKVKPVGETTTKQDGGTAAVVPNADKGLTDTPVEKTETVDKVAVQQPAEITPIVNADKADGTEALTPAADTKIEKAPAKPQDDPAFQGVLAQVDQTADKQQQHPDAQSRVAQSQNASQIDPALEKGGQAGMMQVDNMSGQKKGTFNAAVFKASLMQSIETAMPKNEPEAKKFKDSNELGKVQQHVQGEVQQGKDGAAGAIEGATRQAPPTDKVKVKPAVPLKEEKTGAKPVIKQTNFAAPKPKTEAEISLKKEAAEPDKLMAENNVSDEQLAGSNEPSFTKALDSKNEAKEQAENAPAEYRLAEGPALATSQAGAGTLVGGAMGAFAGMRGAAFGGVNAGKAKAKTGDEQIRQRVAGQMLGMYNTTKRSVDTILQQLDSDVLTVFTAGINSANKAFEDNVKRRLDKHYGISTWDDAISEFFNGLPPEIDAIFQDEKLKFTKAMAPVIDRVAVIVETGLNKATDEIAKGKKQLEDYWKAQPAETKKIAGDAYKEINGKYADLEKQVEDKQQGLITALTDAYVNALGGLQEKFDTIKSEKMGLLGLALNFVSGVIKTIMQLKDMLLNTMSRVAHVVEDIIAHPIEFLGNMVEAVGTGFKNFAGNAMQHLKTGFFEWLMGAVPAGIKFPDNWDLKGIFGFVTQMFSLTWDAIKTKVVKKVGQPVMDALETGFEIFTVIKRDGIGGLWEYIKEKIGDLKTMVVDGLMDMLQSQVIQAGITWLLGLLTPAGAFVKACQAIYKIIMWFVNNAQRMMELVNTIIDSAADIVAHNLAGASAKVENAMGRIIPIAIGFLAGLLGIGNLSKKVGDIIDRVKVPITKAIDWVVDKAVAFADKLGITKMIEKGTKWVQDKVTKIGDKVMGWLGIKKQFTSNDGHKHQIFTEGEGQSMKVMVASDAKPMEQILSELDKAELTANEKQLKNDASNIHDKLHENAKINVYDTDSVKQTEKTKKRDDDMEALVEQLLEKLKPLLPKIPGGLQNIPPVIMPNLSSGPASGFVVEYLTKERLTVGEAANKFKGELRGWRRLQVAGLTSSSSEFYVKMHLLHAGLGGPATAGNLTPAFSTENTKFYHEVEKTAVEYVKTAGTVMWYEIVVNYGSAYDGDYADSVYMKYGTYIQENGKFVKDPNPLGQRPSGKLTGIIPIPRIISMKEGQFKSISSGYDADFITELKDAVLGGNTTEEKLKKHFMAIPELNVYYGRLDSLLSHNGKLFNII